MKCEDFLPSLETGGAWRRLAARLHSARCPRCVAARRQFAAALRELAEPAEVSSELRAKWVAAADEAPSPAVAQPATAKARTRRTFALACAASITAVVTVALLLRPEDPRQVTKRPMPPLEIDTSQEFTRLETSLVQLDVELRQVEQEIELMQARQLAKELLRRHGQP